MFKNLSIYAFDAPLGVRWPDALADSAFRPCGRLESERSGWVPPDPGQTPRLYLNVAGASLLTLRSQSRLLPASVLREAVDDARAEREAAEGRPLRKREVAELRERLLVDMLPRAFLRNRHTSGCIDPITGLLVVDAATWSEAEAFTEFLRATLRRLHVHPWAPSGLSGTLTRWLLEGPPGMVRLGENATLYDPAAVGSEAKLKRHDLSGDLVREHIRAGQQVTELDVSWCGRFSVTLCADGRMRRFKMLDVAADEDTTDFLLLLGELRGALPALGRLLGEQDDG